MVTVGEGLPQLSPLRSRCGGLSQPVSVHHVSDALLPFRRKGQDAVALHRPGMSRPRPCSRPLSSHGRGACQSSSSLVAAVVEQQFLRLLDVGGLPPGQADREGRRLQVGGPLVHGRFPHLPDSGIRIADGPGRSLWEAFLREETKLCQWPASRRKITQGGIGLSECHWGNAPRTGLRFRAPSGHAVPRRDGEHG